MCNLLKVAGVSISSNYKSEFSLNSFSTKKDVISAIESIQYNETEMNLDIGKGEAKLSFSGDMCMYI